MGWLIHPKDVPVPHQCFVPGERSARFNPDFPKVQFVTSNVAGALWVCECGQHWQGRNTYEWWPVSNRIAKKAIRDQKS